MKRKGQIILFTALLFSLFQCGGGGSRDTVVLRVPVTIEEVTRGDIASYISLTGTLLSSEEMIIPIEVTGTIHFRKAGLAPPQNGDQVSAGQKLAEIENEEYELNLRIESKRLAMEQAARDLVEKRKLGEMGGIPPRDVEAAERNKIDTEASYKSALIELEKMNIKAPMSGVLTDMNFFTEGQRVSAGSELGKVTGFRTVRCELNVTNDDIDDVFVGQEVVVTNFAYEDETFTGRVSKMSPTIDPTTRTFKVEVEIDNPDLRLRPGMFVKADIVVSKKTDVLTIPRHVILTRNNRSIVFVVEEQVAKEREVTIGLQDAESAEIVSGLSENDRLVIRGYETLKDNTKVRVSR